MMTLAAILLICLPLTASAQAPDLFDVLADADTAQLAAFLSSGADPNARDGEGRTPLMQAASRGRVAALTALLDFGADTRYRDKTLWTAGMYARASGETEAAVLLESRETRQGVVNAANVRLRAEPGLEGGVLGELQTGDLVALIGARDEVVSIGDRVDRWRKVRTADGRVGWAFGAYIDVDPRILDDNVVLAVLAWRVWTELTRQDGQWVVATPCEGGGPTIELWLSERETPRLTHYLGGDAADLFEVTGITAWGNQLILDLTIIYAGDARPEGVLPEATLHPGDPETGLVGWTLPGDGVEPRWCVPEERLGTFEVVRQSGCPE